MTWFPIQGSFASGEVTPEVSSQPDSPLAQTGLSSCRNMYPTHLGTVTTRPGLEFAEAVAANYTGDARVIPVDMGVDKRIILVITGATPDDPDAGMIYTYTDESFAQTIQAFQNSSFRVNDEWTAPHWTHYKSGGTIIQYDDDPSKTSHKTEGDDHHVLIYAASPVGSNISATAEVSQTQYMTTAGATTTLKYHLLSGPAFGEGDAQYECTVKLQLLDSPGQPVVHNQTYNAGPFQEAIVSTVIPELATYTGKIKFSTRVHAPVNNTERAIYLLSAQVTYEIPPSATVAPVAVPYDATDLAAIQYVQEPYTNPVVFVHPDHYPHVYSYAAGVATFGPITFDDGTGNNPPKGNPPHWVLDPNATDGYPRACGAHQGRMILGGSYKEPQKIWASQAGEWIDLTLPEDTTLSDEPFHYTMTTLGYIQWIHGGSRTMLHGTSNGEHVISSSSAGVLSGTDIQVSEHSTNGSAHVQSERAGHEVMYATADGRQLMAINYSHETESYRSDNMVLSSPHILRDGIKRIAYARKPFKIVWCTLKDGTMAAMSYDPGTKMLGWHRHDTLGGTVLDMAEGRLQGEDRIYAVVTRTVNGVPNLQLEAMRTYENDKVIAMDNYTLTYFDGTLTEITGLERLEGQDVMVQTTKTLYGPLVVSGGSVTLPEAITTSYIVGVPFEQEIKTLPARPMPNIQGSFGSKKTFSRIGIRLYESSLPTVNGVQYKQHPGKAYSKGWGDYASGVLDDYHQQHLGWDYLSPITIRQTEPLKLTITGLFGKLTDEDI